MVQWKRVFSFLFAFGFLTFGFGLNPAVVQTASAQMFEGGTIGTVGDADDEGAGLDCVVTSLNGELRNCTASEEIKACLGDTVDALAQCLDDAKTFAQRLGCYSWDLFDRFQCASDVLGPIAKLLGGKLLS